jgi:hypothetical protein
MIAVPSVRYGFWGKPEVVVVSPKDIMEIPPIPEIAKRFGREVS